MGKEVCEELMHISKKYTSYILILLLCIFSRLITTVNYVEDNDSENFLLAIYNFDLISSTPHFPGYPVFIFLAKIFTFFTGDPALAFSLIGGLSVFGIIYFANELLYLLDIRIPVVILFLLVFFNPLIWLMSNRYMPDLLGVSLLSGAAYLYAGAIKGKALWPAYFWITAGLVAGTKLTYLPILVLPGIHLLRQSKPVLSLFGIAAACLWMVPMTLDSGASTLITAAISQITGHFYNWGGTVLTEAGFGSRLIGLLKDVVADGLGGYWPGRNWVHLLITFGTFFFIGVVVFRMLNRLHRQSIVINVITGSTLLYLGWIFFFQNIIWKPRHVLPLIPFLLVLIAQGMTMIRIKYRVISNVAIILFFLSIFATTISLAMEHKNPTTALDDICRHIIKNGMDDKDVLILASETNNRYLSEKLNTSFNDITSSKITYSPEFAEFSKIIVIGRYDLLLMRKEENLKVFHQHQYVNRSSLPIEYREYTFHNSVTSNRKNLNKK